MNRDGSESCGRALGLPPGNPELDWRPLVLLAIGLALLAANLPGASRLLAAREGQGRGEEAALIWLNGSSIPAGLYLVPRPLLPPAAVTFAGLYHQLGLDKPPDVGQITYPPGDEGAVAPAAFFYPVGLGLESHEPPRPTAYPPALDFLLFCPIPVNRAEAEVLATIAGIGPQLAARIVALRQEKGGFREAADLLAVPGIGPAKLELLKHHLSFE